MPNDAVFVRLMADEFNNKRRRMMSLRFLRTWSMLVLFVEISAGSVRGQPMPLVVQTPTGAEYLVTPFSNIGFSFQMNQPISVSALGIWDYPTDGSGLFFAHPVGLWTSSGTLLGSVTVPAGSGGSLVGQYRYADLSSPIVLSIGQTYVLGALYPYDITSDSDPFPSGSFQLAGVATRLAGLGVANDTNNLVFPNGSPPFATNAGGPNLHFTPVPEPSTLALAGIVIPAMGWWMRRRRFAPGCALVPGWSLNFSQPVPDQLKLTVVGSA
jgi:hypothetical protein